MLVNNLKIKILSLWLLALCFSSPVLRAEGEPSPIIGSVTDVPISAFSDVDYFTSNAPQQTGVARRSSPILYTGLYKLPSDLIETEIYNVGQRLPILEKDGEKFCFVRGVDDYYTNRNYVWAAKSGGLSITGSPGSIPLHSKINEWIEHDGVDAILGSNGILTKIFRDHRDESFDEFLYPSLRMRFKGPIWKTKQGNEPGNLDFSYQISLKNIQTRFGLNDTANPELQQVKLKFAFYDISTGSTAGVSIQLNTDENQVIDFPLSTAKREKVVTASLPLSYLGGDASPTSVDFKVLRYGSGAAFRYDFSELYIPCYEGLEGYLLVDHSKQDGSFLQKRLLVEVEPSEVNRFIKVKDANFALDVTKMGGESFLELTENGFRIPANNETTYIYFSQLADSITFSNERTLASLDLTNFDYVAIAQKDANYFTNYRSDRPSDETLAKLWDRKDDTISGCMASVYSASLFDTWKNTKVNNLTIEDVLRQDGHRPTLVSLEDVVDVYGGGIVSPKAIENFLNLSTSRFIKNICLVGGTSVDTKKRQAWADPDSDLSLFVQTLGIPSRLYYGQEYLGFIYSDDSYAGEWGQRITRSVGRIPVFTEAGLQAWLQKRITFQPGEAVNFVAGEIQPSGPTLAFPFDKEQEMLLGKIPSVLMTVKKDSPWTDSQYTSSNLKRKWQEAIEADVSLSFYQGHGTISFLSEFEADILNTKTVRSKPSCFVLATCDAGKYYKGELNINSTSASLAYMLLTGKSAGDVDQSALDRAPNANKGAVNLIASTGFTGAFWESYYTREMVNAIQDSDDLTWGELVNCKFSLGLDSIEDVKAFQLFGDPAMRVMKSNYKQVVMTDKLLKDKLPFQLDGEWSSDLKAGLTWQYGANDGVDTEWKTAKNSVFEDNQNLNEIDLSSTNLINANRYQVRLFSDLNIGDTTIAMCMGKSPVFYVDRLGPAGGVFITPQRLEDIKTFAVRCEVAHFVDEVYEDEQPFSTVEPVGYRFLLKQTNTPYVSFDSGIVPQPNFTFTPILSEFCELIKYNGLFEIYCYAYDQFGNESTRLIQYVYLRNESESFEDIDNDGLDDHWEINTFGSIEFTNGSYDSNGSGLTDRESYLSDREAYEFSLNLKAGWNLISIPCQVSSEVVSFLKNEIRTVFYYDAISQFYRKFSFDQLLEGSTNNRVVGLWVFAQENSVTPIKFKGSAPLENLDQFENGWNLFGYRRNHLVPQGSELGPVFSWLDPEYRVLEPDTLLHCLKGYWIKKSAEGN